MDARGWTDAKVGDNLSFGTVDTNLPTTGTAVPYFTIEAIMPESRVMDRYVTLGEGYPDKLLSSL